MIDNLSGGPFCTMDSSLLFDEILGALWFCDCFAAGRRRLAWCIAVYQMWRINVFTQPLRLARQYTKLEPWFGGCRLPRQTTSSSIPSTKPLQHRNPLGGWDVGVQAPCKSSAEVSQSRNCNCIQPMIQNACYSLPQIADFFESDALRHEVDLPAGGSLQLVQIN